MNDQEVMTKDDLVRYRQQVFARLTLGISELAEHFRRLSRDIDAQLPTIRQLADVLKKCAREMR